MPYKTRLGYVVLIFSLIVLWIYIVVVFRSAIVSNTSIEVNVIGHEYKNAVQAENAEKENGGKFAGKSIRKLKYHIPKFMLELYEKNKSSRKSGNNADLVRSLIPSETEKLNGNDVLEEFSENHLLIFNIPKSAKGEIFIEAELRILTQIELKTKDKTGVKKSIKLAVYDQITKEYASHNEFEIQHFNDTWLSFNLTHEVRRILKADYLNQPLKIMITVSAVFHQLDEPHNHLRLSILPTLGSFEHDHDYPILILSYSVEEDHQVKHQRNRRNIEEDYEEETNVIWNGDLSKKIPRRVKRNSCRRRPLYVDFSEIRFDLWIVQPRGYEAYQCQGRCLYPVADHLNPTQHAIMQALINSVDPSKASRSCCVPTVLDSISVLYVDERGVLTYRFAYKDMVVLECGCR